MCGATYNLGCTTSHRRVFGGAHHAAARVVMTREGVAVYPHVTAVINAKGGVQKTTVIAALAHKAVADGRRVLVVDLDPQGNCAKALGFADEPLPNVEPSDGGAALSHALITGEPLTPVTIRPGMSVCAGGPLLSKALREIATWEPARKFQALNTLIEPIADEFDMVLIDTPPTNLDIQALTLGVAATVVIPCEIADDTAEDGVIGALTMVAAARKRGNPTITVAGIVLAATRLSHSTFRERRVARATATETKARLHEFDPTVHILTNILRQRADANLVRRHGRSATELLSADDIALARGQRRNLKRLRNTVDSLIDELYPLVAARATDNGLACQLPAVQPHGEEPNESSTVDVTETSTSTSGGADVDTATKEGATK